MRAVASYILKGSSQAILSATVPAVLSLSAPFMLKLILIYFSGIVVALVTLRMGPRQGFTVLLVVTVASVLVAQFSALNNIGRLDLWNTLYLWVFIWLGASVLQTTRSLVLMLEVTGLLAILTILTFFVLVDDPLQVSKQLLEPVRIALGHPESGIKPAEVTTIINSAARLLVGSVVSFTLTGVIICLFAARSWQARLFNPGGFRQEFMAMRFGRQIGLLSLVMIVVLMLSMTDGQIFGLVMINISMVAGLLFVIVGLSVVHGLVSQRDKKGFWLAVVYALLITLSKLMVPLLVVLAFSDIWVDYRARFRK